MGKKFWLAFIGGLVAMYALGGLFHLVIAGAWLDRVMADIAKPGGTNMMGITLYYIVLAFMMAYIYPKGYAGGSPMPEGLRFGLMIGILVYISEAFHQFGAMNIALGPALAHGVWHVVEASAAGIVIGKIYGETGAETVAAESPAPEAPAPEAAREPEPPKTEAPEAATPETMTGPAEESSEETA